MGLSDGSMLKNLPTMQETQKLQVGSLSWEDPLQEEMATHSSILAWKSPKDRVARWSAVHRVAKRRTRLNTHFVTYYPYHQ